MRSLQAAGHSVIALAPLDSYADQFRDVGIEFYEVPISGAGTNPLAELKSNFIILKILRRERIDLVLSYTSKGNLYSGLVCRALDLHFVPNVSGLGRVFIHQSFLTSLVRILYKASFVRAHTVFFQNKDDMSMFLEGALVSASQAELLPGSGVDLERFRPASLKTRLHTLGLVSKAPVFLLVARMLWDKGIGEFVQAARCIKKQFPQARFQILGFLDVANPSAISRSDLENWIVEGVVEYLGQTDDVRPFLAQADCVVLPSYREGTPRSLLEAAASALPVICADTPGCRDTVIEGVTGFLCRPESSADLSKKLIKFIDLSPQQRAEMGQRARLHMENKFDERFVIDRYLRTISKIVSGQNPA